MFCLALFPLPSHFSVPSRPTVYSECLYRSSYFSSQATTCIFRPQQIRLPCILWRDRSLFCDSIFYRVRDLKQINLQLFRSLSSDTQWRVHTPHLSIISLFTWNAIHVFTESNAVTETCVILSTYFWYLSVSRQL